MSSYLIKINGKRCISCKACEVHCKSKNRVPEGARLGQLVTIGPVKRKEKPRYLNLFLPCFHCETPWCVHACPTGALYKRDKDGIVMVQEELCVGCKACIMSCPWDIPQWDETNGRIMKCDYCSDRIDQGEKPACVTACTAHALSFIDPNQASASTRETFASRVLLSRQDKK